MYSLVKWLRWWSLYAALRLIDRAVQVGLKLMHNEESHRVRGLEVLFHDDSEAGVVLGKLSEALDVLELEDSIGYRRFLKNFEVLAVVPLPKSMGFQILYDSRSLALNRNSVLWGSAYGVALDLFEAGAAATAWRRNGSRRWRKLPWRRMQAIGFNRRWAFMKRTDAVRDGVPVITLELERKFRESRAREREARRTPNKRLAPPRPAAAPENPTRAS